MRKKFYVIILSLLFSIILWASISLSNVYYTTFDVNLKIKDFPEGYTTGSALPGTISVRLKGNGWKLITSKLTTGSNYIISAGKDSGIVKVNLHNFLPENQWLTSNVEVIDVMPDTLSFYVEKIASKKVKIIPRIALTFKPGYGLASPVRVIPDSTTVYGPVSAIKNLKAISTGQYSYERLEGRIAEQINLAEIPGMVYTKPKVYMVINVQRIVEKNFDNIPVKIFDVPDDRDVVLLPNKITLGIKGGIDILGKLTPEQMNAYIYYRNVVLDTVGNIIPHIELPQNVTLQYIKPERLRYIIKKFD